MPFPRKFQHLLELELEEVDAPDYIWLVYAVCAVTPEGCGWGGWMIEAAFKRTDENHPTGTGDRLVPASDHQTCPRCGRETYRTGAALRMVPSDEQTPPLRPGIDYELVAPEFDDT